MSSLSVYYVVLCSLCRIDSPPLSVCVCNFSDGMESKNNKTKTRGCNANTFNPPSYSLEHPEIKLEVRAKSVPFTQQGMNAARLKDGAHVRALNLAEQIVDGRFLVSAAAPSRF